MLKELLDFFIRTHRSYAVNLCNVNSPLKLSKDSIFLKEGVKFPISSLRKEEIIEKFNQLRLNDTD